MVWGGWLVGQLGPKTSLYTAQSHPRVFGLYQLRGDGRICRFAESYAVGMLSDQHIAAVLDLPYRPPEYAVVDKSAAELKVGCMRWTSTRATAPATWPKHQRAAPRAWP